MKGYFLKKAEPYYDKGSGSEPPPFLKSIFKLKRRRKPDTPWRKRRVESWLYKWSKFILTRDSSRSQLQIMKPSISRVTCMQLLLKHINPSWCRNRWTTLPCIVWVKGNGTLNLSEHLLGLPLATVLCRLQL
ncbi:hypothetical protein Ancab_017340 [Ancistrocladus abbreviatus]